MKLAMLNQLYSFNVLRSNNISEYTLEVFVWLFWHVYMVKTARTGPNEIAKDEKKKKLRSSAKYVIVERSIKSSMEFRFI